MFVGDGRW